MTGLAYYNEIDPVAAQWLRNLIAAGHIAPGVVDERSIEDVKPYELQCFTQCHFFAGVGVWSLALRRAGWPDSRPVWTGSCPCQPFSASGKKSGFADERHLWPAFAWLIRQCGPTSILGEQVASKAAEPWIDLVQADLESLGYAFGCVPFPSAGVGAPHIRDRAYWVAHSGSTGLAERVGNGCVQREAMVTQPGQAVVSGSDFSRMGNTAGTGPLPVSQSGVHSGEEGGGARNVEPERSGAAERVAYAELQQRPIPKAGSHEASRRDEEPATVAGLCRDSRPGPTNGFWAAADWLFCRDGKWRPVGPGTFPLAHGAPARVGRLRAYGNAINAEAATVFIQSVMECIP